MRALSMLALFAVLCVAFPVHAATVTYLGSDGLTDGSHYVGPYRLRIDGVDHLALCYDFAHTVFPNQTWQADLHEFGNLSQAYYASLPGAADQYQMEAWLFDQLLNTKSSADRIAIQHAAWSLFSSTAPNKGAAPWLAAAAASLAAGSPGLDLATFRVVNSVAGASSQVQGFLVSGYPGSPVPEPVTMGLAGAALAAFFLLRRYSAAVK